MQISPLLSLLALVAPAFAAQNPREMNHAQMARTFGHDGLSSEKCYGSPIKPWTKGCYPGWYSGTHCGPVKGHQPKPWDGGDVNQCGSPHAKDWSCCKPHALHNGHNGPQRPSQSPPKPPCKGKPGHGKPGHSTPGKPGHPNPGHPNPGHPGEGAPGNPPTPTGSAPVTQPSHPAGPVCDGEYEQTFFNYTTVAKTGYYQGTRVGAAIIDNENYLTYGLVDSTDECLDRCDDIKDCAFANVYQEFNSTIKDGYGPGKLTCALFSKCSGESEATNYGGQDDPTYIVDSTAYCKSGKCP